MSASPRWRSVALRSDALRASDRTNDPLTFPVPLDPRVATTIGAITADGTVLAMTPERFTTPTETWQITTTTPTGVAELLLLSRRLCSHGCFVYDFVTVAAHYALIALEAALSERLNRSDSFARLIERAQRDAVIDAQEADMLDKAARHLRNDFSHAKRQVVWTPAMSASVIASIHLSVARLFPD